jgi:hypothetical protein
MSIVPPCFIGYQGRADAHHHVLGVGEQLCGFLRLTVGLAHFDPDLSDRLRIESRAAQLP